MSENTLPIEELNQLIDGLLARSLDATQLARLNALLRTSETARHLYLDQLGIHADLVRRSLVQPTATNLADLLKGETESIPLSPVAAGSIPATGSRGAARSPVGSSKPLARWLGSRAARNVLLYGSILRVAVLFYGAFGLLIWQMGQLRFAEPRPEVVADRADSPDGSPQRSRPPRGEAREQALSTAAVLVNAEACLWQLGDDRVKLRSGIELHAEDALKLLAGTAELQFANGAKVLLEGPAQFIIEEAGRGKLDRGKLVAHVPPQAIGFTVATPNSAVVDLGTEFGVEVAENGATEVHVLRGMVEFASRDGLSESGSLPTPTRLSAGEAARVDVASAEPVAIRFAADKFDDVAAAPLRPSHAAPRPVDLSHATATQPSAWHESPSDFAARAAIDGNDRTFSHTSGDDQLAWWQLDLGSVQPLVATALHNRQDVCRGWLRDIQVKVLAEDGETVVFTSRIYNPRNALTGDENNFRDGPDLLEIELRSEAGTPALGRFVRVERLPCTFMPKVWWGDKKSAPLTEAMLKAAKGALVLSEVEVYAAATEESESPKAAGEPDGQSGEKDTSPRGALAPDA